MPQPSLVRPVEILERKVENLELLPARVTAVEGQILQLRQDIRDEFSAMRQEVAKGVARLEVLIHDGDEETRRQMLALHQDTVARLESLLHEGDEETRRYMRVLHEDVISRIALIQEGRPRPKRGPR